MDETEPGVSTDELLVPFLASRSDEEARGLLGDLLERHLGPVIRGTVRRRLHLSPTGLRSGPDAEDLVGEATAKLVERLQALRDGGRDTGGPQGASDGKRVPGPGISRIAGYAATVASSVCDEYLRRRYPERRRLKNRVHYLLTHRQEFALWETGEAEFWSGLAPWRGHRGTPASEERLRELEARPGEFEERELGGKAARREGPVVLVSAVFRWLGGPVELDRLVSLLAVLWQVRESDVRIEESEESLERRIAKSARGPDVAGTVDRRTLLSRLWSEICELPARQRTAVLLNLRDEEGCSAIEFFPVLGVASIRQIANAIEIPLEEFARLWNELPLEDSRIAAMLGLTRQQVINLRKSARERLARRIRDS